MKYNLTGIKMNLSRRCATEIFVVFVVVVVIVVVVVVVIVVAVVIL